MAAVVTGIPELDRRLRGLSDKLQRKVGNPAVKAGLTVYAKAMRAAVPAGLPTVKAAMGSRMLTASQVRKSGLPPGSVGGKAGGGVGKKSGSKSDKRAAKRGARGKGGGVGIGARNIHWWVMGTKGRRTATHSTGRMPAHPVVRQAASQAQSAALSAMKSKLTEALAREAHR
jgi:hypothetical protein